MASKLEELANQFRVDNTRGNIYQNEDSRRYTPTHTRALSDDTTPINGKGTGVFLDTNNGGGEMDIKGNPNQPGSGRNAAITMNKAKWGYSPETPYKHPDTDSNEGQFKIRN